MDRLSPVDFVELCRDIGKIELRQSEKEAVEKGRAILEKAIKSGEEYYAVNTGVGALLDRRIPPTKMLEFQENLILSHACGVGKPLEECIVRGMILHMILNLKSGYSGIRLETLELLIGMFNRNIIPVVPEKGSLGASGDLIPQAHIALTLIGRGRVFRMPGAICATTEEFDRHNLRPIKLQAGEAITLLNGTSLMTSLMAFTAVYAKNLITTAHIAAAMSIAALGGTHDTFDFKAQNWNRRAYRDASTDFIRFLLSSKKQHFSDQSGMKNKRQKPYSLRCSPRVLGSFLETLSRYVWPLVAGEINNFSGNPEIFLESEKVAQGRDNFHGQSLAQAADALAIVLANLSGISERRIDKLLNGSSKDLPMFLMRGSGLNTGLMIVQYTAVSLVAENRFLANPASVHSIPVAAGQEDFVSMGALGARRVWEILKNAEMVVAIELLCAAQAFDFKRSVPGDSWIRKAHKIIREIVPHFDKDEEFCRQIENLAGFIHDRDGFLKKIGLTHWFDRYSIQQ
ncbi:aromatic amino acid lyase [Candidatus Falkowbacteria bacterium]|nr:aromatic amino acid lyase [Candidatus Falkowbacteria bacterium]